MWIKSKSWISNGLPISISIPISLSISIYGYAAAVMFYLTCSGREETVYCSLPADLNWSTLFTQTIWSSRQIMTSEYCNHLILIHYATTYGNKEQGPPSRNEKLPHINIVTLSQGAHKHRMMA